jgi:hypothetical protein
VQGLVNLEKTIPDSVLEVIPVHGHGEYGGEAEGLHYVTRTPGVGSDARRTAPVLFKGNISVHPRSLSVPGSPLFLR